MTLLSIPIALPPDVEEVIAGDVDNDGRNELIFVSSPALRNTAAKVLLTIQWFGADGRPGARSSVDLGNRALLWEVDHGLWGLDRDGLLCLDAHGAAPVRLAKFPTALTNLGPTQPHHADLARDLDGDTKPELVAWSAGRYLAFHNDGSTFGSIPAPATGDLSTRYTLGGEALTAAANPATVVFGDFDGDGRVDLLLPRGDRIQVYFTGTEVGARAADVRLPVDLEPEPPRPGSTEVRRDIGGIWLQDLDGDHKVDLGMSRYVHGASWFSATVEWLWARGTGSGFEPIRVVPLAQAAFNLRPVDADGDGDQDLQAILADVSIPNLARALLSREARGELIRLPYAGGYPSKPISLRPLTFPIENFDRYHLEFEGDVDGDKQVDLVTNDGGTTVRVYRGGAAGLANQPTWEAAVAVPDGDNTLQVHDLTGDGRAEIIVWGSGRTTGTVLRVP